MMLTGSRGYVKAPVPKMPTGLVELMNDLSREVIKSNPSDLYDFCANHMHKLLEIRDGPIKKKSLTLEQKIARAQEKVRQRIKERCSQIDQNFKLEIVNSNNTSAIKHVHKADIDKITSPSVIQHLEFPNHLNQDLKITDENIYKENHDNLKDLNCIKNENIHVTDCIVNDHCESKIYSNECQSINEYKDKDCNDEVNVTETDNVTNFVIESIVIEDKQKHSKVEHKKSDSTLNHNKIDSKEHIEVNECIDIKKIDVGDCTESTICNVGDTHLSEVEPLGTDMPLEKESIKSENQEYLSDNTPELNDDKHTIANIIEAIEEFEEETLNIPNEIDEDLSSSEIAKSEEIFEGIELDDHNNSLNTENKIDDEELLATGNNLHEYNDKHEKSEIKLVDIPIENNPTSEIICNGVKEIDEDKSVNNLETGNDMQKQHIMDLETAAITIQKVFRNFLFKSKSSTVDDDDNIDSNSLIEDVKREENILLPTKERRTVGISRMDTVLQTVNEEKSLSLSTDDSSTLSSAATIIQAHVRGFLVRNKLNSNKSSLNSLVNSQDQSPTSLEGDTEQQKRTVLNIHIVPEGHIISRDESLLTSVDLPFDNSPLSSINLHPLGYDKSQPRKQLKRGDAIQSISPPSNNSGKSIEIESVTNTNDNDTKIIKDESITSLPKNNEVAEDNPNIIRCPSEKEVSTIKPDIDLINSENHETEVVLDLKNDSVELKENISSDEMDVIMPLVRKNNSSLVDATDNKHMKLMHSGEFHDVVLPTKVLRGDSTVVREFKNVLVYFMLWNNA